MPEHLKVWTRRDVKQAVEQNAPFTGLFRKQYATTIKDEGSAAEPSVLQFVISTASIDRDGDTVAVNGWNVANFQKTPSVLWAHDYHMPPVAQAVAVWTDAGALRARAQFTPPDLSAFGDMVYRMYLGGFLRATSVGFIATERMIRRDPETGDWQGIDFLAQELLEFSCVPVPANPDALIEARSKGIALEPYEAWIEDVLDETRGLDVWVSRKGLERQWKTLQTAHTVVIPDGLKSGRVLSAANEAVLRSAADAMASAATKINAVLEQVTQEESGTSETEKAEDLLAGVGSPTVEDGITFEGAGFESPDLGFDLDDDTPDAEIDLDALAIDDLKTLVAPSVREAVRHARMMATGRLD